MDSIAAFEFATATKIVFGRGALAQIGGIVKSFGTKALIVTGKNTERAKPLTSILEKNNITVIESNNPKLIISSSYLVLEKNPPMKPPPKASHLHVIIIAM
jgi:hypothetical protein